MSDVRPSVDGRAYSHSLIMRRMNVSQSLAWAGLALSFVGSVWTSIGVLKPSAWVSDPRVQWAREDTIRIVGNARRRGYTAPPYSPEEVAAAVEESQRWERDELEKLSDQVSAAYHRERWITQRWTLLGLLMVALGGVAQGASLITAQS